jgi:muramoyltetrapeptide carboxypeptidase
VSVPALTRPRRLEAGDRVVVVSPSGPVPKDRLESGCAILRGWGLDVVVAPHALDVHDRFAYLGGSDADRAGDLQDAWLDPSVAAVLCARGGYGVQRILDRLDWSAMRGVAPKVVAGYSDITALHEAFATRLGVATLYAPMVGARVFLTDDRTAELFRRTLFEPESVQTLTSPTARTLVRGTARGVTVGGCLGLLAAGLGTATGRGSARGGILLLEDVDEKAYRIDGHLTHLLRAGWFDGVAGVVLGSWKDCEPVEDVMLDRLAGLGVPVVSELGFGHGDSSLTVPLGLPATLDADAVTLTVDVPALA